MKYAMCTWILGSIIFFLLRITKVITGQVASVYALIVLVIITIIVILWHTFGHVKD